MSDKRVRKQYSKEFKAEAVKLVTEQGMKVSDVAKDLGVSLATVNSWLSKQQHGRRNKTPGSGETVDLARKVRELEHQVKRLTMEREILKKAMGYFVELPK